MNAELKLIIEKIKADENYLNDHPFLRPIADKIAELGRGCTKCGRTRKEQELEDQYSVTKATTPPELWGRLT